ncbi:MAG: DUF3158 family protein [Acidobacteria bacterium]|nr:DUF3158 family protein [Acidobacteriota bacterium]
MHTLEKHLDQARDNLKMLKSKLTAHHNRVKFPDSSLQMVQSQLAAIDDNLLRLRNTRQQRKGLLGSLLGLTAIPPKVQSDIASLQSQRLTFESQKRELENLIAATQAGESSVESAQEWISKLEEAVTRKRRKEEKLNELRAAAARNVGQSRMVGSSVKRKLKRQPWCPYCGEPLGSDTHVDHIYPISKGGRSVPRNMVYVCITCNRKKKDLTLNSFISQYELNRDEIEARLAELGKEY